VSSKNVDGLFPHTDFKVSVKVRWDLWPGGKRRAISHRSGTGNVFTLCGNIKILIA